MATKTETNDGDKIKEKDTSDTGSNIETISLTNSEKSEGKYSPHSEKLNCWRVAKSASKLTSDFAGQTEYLYCMLNPHSYSSRPTTEKMST